MVDLLSASFLQNLRCLAGNNNLVKNSMSRTESLKTLDQRDRSGTFGTIFSEFLASLLHYVATC